MGKPQLQCERTRQPTHYTSSTLHQVCSTSRSRCCRVTKQCAVSCACQLSSQYARATVHLAPGGLRGGLAREQGKKIQSSPSHQVTTVGVDGWLDAVVGGRKAGWENDLHMT